MNLLDRLDELDYRLHLRPRPGIDQGKPRPLSRAHRGVLRTLCAAMLLCALLLLVAAIVRSQWRLLVFPILIVFQLAGINKTHGRQIYRALRDPENGASTVGAYPGKRPGKPWMTARPPSAWLALALTLLPSLATAGFLVGAIVLLVNPPGAGEELPRNAWLAFVFYAGITGVVAGLGVLSAVGITREWRWSRPLGAALFVVAAVLIAVALWSGANDATPGAFIFGGAMLLTCLMIVALILRGR